MPAVRNRRDPRYLRDHPVAPEPETPDLDAFAQDVRIYLEARNAYLAACHAFMNEPYAEQMRAWCDAIRQFRAVFDLVKPSLGKEHAAEVEGMVPNHIRAVGTRAVRARALINMEEERRAAVIVPEPEPAPEDDDFAALNAILEGMF